MGDTTPDPGLGALPFPPMEAELVSELPRNNGWQYEPKWDGFRGILERPSEADAGDGSVRLWSRNGRPLLRYFPELEVLGSLLPPGSAVDGEIVIARDGRLDFDAMQARLHPAASRVRRLAEETPAGLVAFDLLLWAGEPVHLRPLEERRAALEARLDGAAWPFALSPYTRDADVAEEWLARVESAGLDGVVAKRLGLPYAPGERDRVLKVKRRITVDCVVSGVRLKRAAPRTAAVTGLPLQIATLSLGLYDDLGELRHVGSAAAARGMGVPERIGPLVAGAPAMPPPGEGSRWSKGDDLPWQPIRPELVVEVEVDKLQGERFRHGARLLRFRPDKDPRQCTLAQVRPARRPGDVTVESLLSGVR